jgi:aryl-alcohol dehydrogenase-like predicted oxidoreductase
MRLAGREVGGIGLGTAQFAFRERSRAESIATVHAALDAGVRLIDTALAYTRGDAESYAEEVVAAALRSWTHESPVVATKGGHFRRGDAFPVDGSPAALRAHCEISLRTLGVDRIDLYQLHHVDPTVPLADSVGALLELREEGKVAEIGLSNVDVGQLDLARGIGPIASVQNRLSLTQASDLPMVHACAERGVAYLAYMPFGGPGGPIAPAAQRIALARAVSPQQVMLGWLRTQSAVVLPLVGASRAETIVDSARLVDLDPGELAALSALAR